MITYDNGQRPGEWADVSCPVQVHGAVRAESVDNELRQMACSAFSTTHVLQAEHHFDCLSQHLLDEICKAIVGTCTNRLVLVLRTCGVDFMGIGKVIGLESRECYTLKTLKYAQESIH